MKCTAFFVVSLIVGTIASPSAPELFDTASDVARQERSVMDKILQTMAELPQQIRDAGLDPFEHSLEASYELPLAIIFNTKGIVDKFVFSGLSDFVIQNMDYSLLLSRFSFNIILPRLSISVDNASGKVVFIGNEYTGDISGSVSLPLVRLNGEVFVDTDEAGALSIRSLALTFSAAGIETNLNANLFGKDASARVNNFFGVTLQDNLIRYTSEVNELLEIFFLDIFNEFLANNTL